MRLGVDVDEVVLDAAPLHDAALRKRGYIPDSRIQNVWGYEESHGASLEVCAEVFREVEQITDVPLIPGAQILNKIVDLPHIEPLIHFVSSRNNQSWDATFIALKHHFSFNFMLLCEVSKGEACREARLDFFVEDGPPHILDIFWNSTTKIYILDKPYNQTVQLAEGLKVLRVKTWDEILIDLQREGYREAVRVSEPPHSL